MNNTNKELEILRQAIDNANILSGKKLAQSKDVKIIIQILENFLRKHKTLCYGGTAVNNILPEQYRFYNRNVEIPDYDFFSPNALNLSKELADIYYKNGYEEVEAKAGIHEGTYKVYVNFMPIADITELNSELFNNLYKKSIKINSISYCPPDFLRMAMYLELSRPMGDVSRWEKILKRLILLNMSYPLKGINCNNSNFQRKFEGSYSEQIKIYEVVRKSFIDQGLIFFGGYAANLYGNYMPKKQQTIISKIPDFDILSENAETSAIIAKEQLEYEGIQNVKINKKKGINGYISDHYEIVVNKDVIAFIYNTISCHSYNIIYLKNEKIKVASIDTILSFYLIFIFTNKPYYDVNRLLCISEFLFKVQLKNRLKQKGLLKRFSIKCYGEQESLEDIRSKKSYKHKSLKNKNYKNGDKEYDKYFLRYIPNDNNKRNKTQKIKKI
tara:strand:- start:2311 stop:3636 length:1326 start_codon:yes stop_codon:yes gene_type:complete